MRSWLIDDEGAGVAAEPVLQPFDAGEIEMVGRLVEQQHVGVLRQRPRDRRPPPLAAGRGRRRPVEVEPDLVGDRLHLVRRGAPARQREIAQGREVGDRRILLEQHDLDPRLDRPPPLVGLDQVGEAFEQGRLARAVAPDQRQPVARADEQVEAAEQPAGSLDQAEIFIGEDGRGHGGAIVGRHGRRSHLLRETPVASAFLAASRHGEDRHSLRAGAGARRGGARMAPFRYVTRSFRPKSMSACSRSASSRSASCADSAAHGPPASLVAAQDAAIRSLGLSARECEILAARLGRLEQGDGAALGISPNTVKTHVARVYEKLEVQWREASRRRASWRDPLIPRTSASSSAAVSPPAAD